jgi:valyl-tRNA synthetase
LAFSVCCDAAIAELLTPMQSYFGPLANATLTAVGPDVASPPLAAHVSLSGMDVYVDLSGLIDVDAEIARKKQEVEKLGGFIASKEKKLSNESFVSRAPADVVQKERDSLNELKEQLVAAQAALAGLAAMRK